MKLFSLFKPKTSKPDSRRPATILREVLDLIPETYRSHRQYLASVEFLDHNEWGLSLESLIELPEETGHFFSEHFWNELALAADRMNLVKEAEYCRQQIASNKKLVGFLTPRGWTTVKQDPTHFQHHIAESVKDEWQKERWSKHHVASLTQKDGCHVKHDGRSGFIYYVRQGKLAEIEFEMGNGMLLYFSSTNGWSLPTKAAFTEIERESILSDIRDQLNGKYVIEVS